MNYTIFKRNIGIIIRQKRQEKNYSVECLAELSDLSYFCIESIELDYIKDLRLGSLYKIAEALEMDIQELIKLSLLPYN